MAGGAAHMLPTARGGLPDVTTPMLLVLPMRATQGLPGATPTFEMQAATTDTPPHETCNQIKSKTNPTRWASTIGDGYLVFTWGLPQPTRWQLAASSQEGVMRRCGWMQCNHTISSTVSSTFIFILSYHF